MPRTITRTEWGARIHHGTPTRLVAAEVRGLALHWPAMGRKPVRGIPEVSRLLRGWQAYHMDDRGWSDIAYQEAVDQDGNTYLLRGLGVRSAANGDQAVNAAWGALLLVLAEGETPSTEMIQAVRRRVLAQRALFPGAKRVVGHAHVRPEPTSCPGPIVLDMLAKGVFEPVPAPVVPKLVLRPGPIAHVAKGVPYFLLNSVRGLRAADKARKPKADRDLLLTKDGVVVVSHWARPLLPHGPRGHDVFVDPLGQLGRARTIASMTWAEVGRLRTKRGGYRINRLDRDLAEAGDLGIGVVLEPKTPDARWRDPELWRGIRARARANGVPSITGYVLPANRAAAAAMNAAGIPTKVLA